jgi:uncharacterized protein (DUF1800 family)
MLQHKTLCTGIFSLSMFLSGCVGDVINNGALVITPQPVPALAPGKSVAFQVTKRGEPYTNITWSVTRASGATGTVSSTGVYTAPASFGVAGSTKTVTIQTVDRVGLGSSTAIVSLQYSQPILTGVAPTSITAGTTTALTLTGAGLETVSTVSVNGVAYPVTVKSDSQISFTYTAASSSSGILSISAISPAPVDATSNQLTVSIQAALITYDAASRFLNQASWAPTEASIAQVRQIGFSAYVDQQLAAGPDYFYTDDDTGHQAGNLFLFATQHDSTQLRTKMAWVWWKIFNTPLTTTGWVNTTVPDTCNRDAFGSFERLLTDVAFNPIMGQTLNYDTLDYPGHPNQNFGRESMQLFSTGPVLLNPDGSAQIDQNGQQIPAYTAADIDAVSRAITGFERPSDWYTGDDPHGLVPLAGESDMPHDQGDKVLLGQDIPANQNVTQDTQAAMKILAAQPNVGPFMGKYLIHELITSNPSPSYVSRITSVWNDDGKGNRGNISAVVKAILLDPEARAGDDFTQLTADEGRFRDPVAYYSFFYRTMHDTANQAGGIGIGTVFPVEAIWASPSIFSYYQQSTTLPGTNLLAPESSLFTEYSVQLEAGFLYNMIYLPPGGDQLLSNFNWTQWGSLASGDGSQFVDHINHLLFHGTMSSQLKAALLSDAQQNSDLQARAQQMLFDSFLSPEAQVQR